MTWSRSVSGSIPLKIRDTVKEASWYVQTVRLLSLPFLVVEAQPPKYPGTKYRSVVVERLSLLASPFIVQS